MPQDEYIIKNSGSFSFSPVRFTDEPRARKIKNIQSIMSRFKDYTENMGSVRKCSLGISRFDGRISLDDFCNSVENYIKDTLDSEPYKTAIYELNKYLMNKISYQIDPKILMKSYNFNYFDSIITLADEYINEICKGKEIQQGDRFEKSAVIINILYSMLLADYVVNIRQIKDDNDTVAHYLWKMTYEIGFLQGEMCLIESHLDINMADIHYKRKSSQAKDKDWIIKHKEIEERDKILDSIYEKPLEYAENQWKKRREVIYHNKMAEEIIIKFMGLRLDKNTLIDKLRPIAKKYHYSDFVEGEFKNKSNISILCNVISNDNYRIKVSFPENTIGWLNEIILMPDFYSKWLKRKGEINLSSELNELIGDTHSSRKKKFIELSEEEQRKIKRLNRLLLEHTYSSITPKSLKFGLMRGWAGKKKG